MTRSFDDTLKRTLDVVASSSALLALAPALVAIGLAVKLDSRGPVLYRGARVGRDGKPFELIKFRTMFAGSNGPTSTSDDDRRITRVGKILRRYKLDELPQLINVLKGDMSLVGPRPQVAWCVATYSEEEREVLRVRPGLTDWSSMRFHDEGAIIAESGLADPDEAYLKLIHPEKMRLQLRYVRERSLRVDAQILIDTVKTLARTRAVGEAA